MIKTRPVYVMASQTDSGIETLCDALSPCQIYEVSLGELLQPSAILEEDYYSPLGLLRGSSRSAALLGLLLYRTVCHGFESYMAHAFRRTAL